MKKVLIDQNKRQFKANLHCHSTMSDGALTPEQLKAEYKKRGYSVLAITDHEHLVNYSHLTEDDFLLITGYEMFVFTLPSDHDLNETSHLNMFSKTPENKMVYYSPETVYSRYAERGGTPLAYHHYLEDREHTVEFVKKAVKDAKAAGYLVSHSHPTWSFEEQDFSNAFEDCFAMELYNHASYIQGYNEYNQHYYDHQIRKGYKMGVLAVDDNHNHKPMDGQYCDSFGGATYILADKLDYGSIIESLENKDFYASTGPQIYSLEVEDGKLTVKTSNADKIWFITNTRNRKACLAAEGQTVNTAEFTLISTDRFVRVEVTDKNGNKAFTRAFFRNEILDE